MEAAVTKSATLLETQIEMILHVRSAWQKLDVEPWRRRQSQAKTRPSKRVYPHARTRGKVERIPFSQSG